MCQPPFFPQLLAVATVELERMQFFSRPSTAGTPWHAALGAFGGRRHHPAESGAACAPADAELAPHAPRWLCGWKPRQGQALAVKTCRHAGYTWGESTQLSLQTFLQAALRPRPSARRPKRGWKDRWPPTLIRIRWPALGRSSLTQWAAGKARERLGLQPLRQPAHQACSRTQRGISKRTIR